MSSAHCSNAELIFDSPLIIAPAFSCYCLNFSGNFHTVECDMEAVLTVVFRISNPQYSFVHVGSEHGRQSVARLQILRLPRGNQEDYAFGDFEYTAHMIVEI